MDQVKIHRFFKKTKKNTTDKKPGGESASVKNEQEKQIKDQQKLRKKVTQLIKKQKVKQVRGIVKEQDDSKPWGQEAHVKVCDFYSCKAEVHHLLVAVGSYWFLYYPDWMSIDAIVNGNSLYTTSS